MDPQRKAVRQRLKNIKNLEEYYEVTRKIKLTEEDFMILDFIFVNGYDYRYIGDMMGYSESTIKHKVKYILMMFT